MRKRSLDMQFGYNQKNSFPDFSEVFRDLKSFENDFELVDNYLKSSACKKLIGKAKLYISMAYISEGYETFIFSKFEAIDKNLSEKERNEVKRNILDQLSDSKFTELKIFDIRQKEQENNEFPLYEDEIKYMFDEKYSEKILKIKIINIMKSLLQDLFQVDFKKEASDSKCPFHT